MTDEFKQVSLDDLLPDDDAPAKPLAPVEPQEMGEQDAAPVVEEQPVQQDAPPASDQPPPDRMVPRAALEDERRKRQELENYLYNLQRQQPAQPQEDPNAISDAFWENPTEFLQKAVSDVATRLERSHQEEIFTTRAELSREVMANRHEDYEEVEQVFLQALERDPTLAQKLGQSKNPAKFAYEEGKKLRLIQDPDAYRARIEAEVLAKYGITAGQPPKQPPPPAPRSLASAPSAPMPPAQGEFSGPTPLTSLIPD